MTICDEKVANKAISLVLVHGAFHTAAYYDRLVERLETQGWECYSVNLRGHGPKQPHWLSMNLFSLTSYVSDVEAIIRRATATHGSPPVVMGHSMGGKVAMMAAHRVSVAGIVLLASMPPGFCIIPNIRLGLRHPLLTFKTVVTMRLKTLISTPNALQEMMFTPTTPTSIVEHSLAGLQDESIRAISEASIIPTTPPTCPALVIGGRDDRYVPGSMTRRTAARMGASLMFVGTGHGLLSEERWEDAAEAIEAWLGKLDG